MIIKLIPQRSDNTLTLAKAGDVLTINGTAYDFTQLTEGATLPNSAIDCAALVGDVTRRNSDVILTLLMPHGANPAPEAAFPADIVNPADGDIALPGAAV